MMGRLALEGIETDDVASVSIRYRNGALGQIHTVIFGRNLRYDFEIHGLEGTLVYDRAKSTVELHTHGVPRTPPALLEQFPSSADDPYAEQAKDFLAATRGEKSVACSIEDGWQTLRAVLAATRSAKSGRHEPVQ